MSDRVQLVLIVAMIVAILVLGFGWAMITFS